MESSSSSSWNGQSISGGWYLGRDLPEFTFELPRGSTAAEQVITIGFQFSNDGMNFALVEGGFEETPDLTDSKILRSWDGAPFNPSAFQNKILMKEAAGKVVV